MYWPVWRLVMEQKATLHELEEHYSLDDILTANEALDLWYEARAPKKR